MDALPNLAKKHDFLAACRIQMRFAQETREKTFSNRSKSRLDECNSILVLLDSMAQGRVAGEEADPSNRSSLFSLLALLRITELKALRFGWEFAQKVCISLLKRGDYTQVL